MLVVQHSLLLFPGASSFLAADFFATLLFRRFFAVFFFQYFFGEHSSGEPSVDFAGTVFSATDLNAAWGMEEPDDIRCLVGLLPARTTAENKSFLEVVFGHARPVHQFFYFTDCLLCDHFDILLTMKKVLIPLAEGFEDIEAVSIVDVLRRGGVGVVTASLGDDLAVVSAHGITMFADARLRDVIEDEYAAIILPGGGLGTKNLKECEPLLGRLKRQKEEGGLLCAICAAPTVLEEAEVLDDEVVTCYPSCASEMSRPVQHVPVIADGQVITGQAPGAAVIFALVVLAHLEDHRRAQIVANGMVTEFK